MPGAVGMEQSYTRAGGGADGLLKNRMEKGGCRGEKMAWNTRCF